MAEAEPGSFSPTRRRRVRAHAARLAGLLGCLTLCGCFSLGPSRLDEDQIGFSRALSSSEKRETLLNVVRLRYADAPSFLEATQVISGYQLQRGVSGGFQALPGMGVASFLTGGAAAQLQESPTFTFQPVTGEQFAQSFVRPLSPAELLPFALGGMPVDVLFRLGVQSVNGLQNAVPLTERGSSGAPAFFALIHDLRVLQIAGLIGVGLVRTEKEPPATAAAPGTAAAGAATPGKVSGRVYLSFSSSNDSRFVAAATEARQLLGMAPDAEEAEVIYGRRPRVPGQVTLLTRSMLGVLSQVAFEVEVPARDVAQGLTPRTGGDTTKRHPVIVIHSGTSAPAEPFVAVQYLHTWFWIEEGDFDSKLAFSVVEILLALAKTITPPGTVITIPAG